MTRRAVSCRVIPNGGKTGQFVPSMEMLPGDRLRLDFSKSVNSFGLAVFLFNVLGWMLSNRGAKSRNEFAAAELHWTMGSGHDPEISKCSVKNPSLGKVKNLEFVVALIEFEGVGTFFRPCRGPLAGARVP